MRAFLVCFCLTSVALAAIFGRVRGVVHDPQHRPIPGASIQLAAVHTQWRTTATADAQGEFNIARVPMGEYLLTVKQPGFAPAVEAITVVAGEAPVLHVEMAVAAASQTTTVTAQAPVANVESSTPTTMVGRTSIARTPGADRSNSLAMITDFVPGAYLVHDQLHVRGGHQVSWLVDGVPVPNTNIASNVGPQIDPKDIDTLEVQRGSYDAAYGDRTYGVFNIAPRSGFERDNEADLVLSAGSFHQTNDALNFGGHSDRFAYFGSVSGNRSNLGLETPSAEVIHDADNGIAGFQSLIFNADAKDQFRLVASQRRDFYQIPNTAAQQAAGIRDSEQESDAFALFSWVRTINANTLLTVSPFYHYNAANYDGGPGDYPISTTDHHASQYAGAQATLSTILGPHQLQFGFYGFRQRDNQLFGLVFHDHSQPDISQSEPVDGQLEAEFVQDKYQPVEWLTLMGGLRQSHFGGNQTENATSPRAGIAVRLPWGGVVVRGNYSRYYQAPPLVTASGPLLQFVTSQNLGLIPLQGERDEEWQTGLTIPIRGWGLDADYFHNRARNFFDHDVVGNSNIFFPLTIERARIRGFEATLRSPRLWHRGQVHVAWSNQIAEGGGAVTGGLTDFSPPAGGWFLLDHDQRTTLNAGFDFNLPHATYASANFYFGSGFANGDAPPTHLPAHGSLDLSLGHDFGERFTLSGTVLNLTNTHLLIDNSVTFGGTHYNDPREFLVELRYRFKY